MIADRVLVGRPTYCTVQASMPYNLSNWSKNRWTLKEGDSWTSEDLLSIPACHHALNAAQCML